MAFLSHNSSDTPGLAPLINVLFWGRCDFPISFSSRAMSRNVWNRLLGCYLVGTGILPNNMSFTTLECYTIFWRITIYSETLHWWAITPMFDPFLIWTLLPNLTFYLIVCGFHRTFATGWHANRGRLLPRTPGPVPLWDLHVFFQSLTNLSWTCPVSGLLSFEHPSVLLFFLLASICYHWVTSLLCPSIYQTQTNSSTYFF